MCVFVCVCVYECVSVCEYAETRTGLDSIWFEQVVEKLTRRLGQGKVLDVGCGEGLLLTIFQKWGWDAFGIDASPWAVDAAKRHGYGLYSGEIESLHVFDSFDLVVSTSTLEHVPQPVEHIRAILRMLKPGGVAYFAGMPNDNKWTRPLGLAYGKGNRPPYHCSYFTVQTARRILRRECLNGLISQRTVRTYGVPSLYKLYRFFTNLVRGGRTAKGRPKQGKGPADTNQRGELGGGSTLMKSFVAANYHLGKPFHLGDKIEITLVRAPAPEVPEHDPDGTSFRDRFSRP